MRWIFVVLLIFIGSLTRAETIVPVKTIRANTILTAEDITLTRKQVGRGLSDLSSVIGMEARVVLYAGRPILQEHLALPAVVNRNEIVPIIFNQSGLTISTHGRALDRGAIGDIIRVMNMSSRTTLFGRVLPDGRVDVAR